MMEAVRTSETSAHSSETTWRYVPEESEPHTLMMEAVRNSETSVHSSETDATSQKTVNFKRPTKHTHIL